MISQLGVLLALAYGATAQSDTLGLSNGVSSFNTPTFTLALIDDSQTAYSLRPHNSTDSFDFIPYDVMSKRDSDGQYNLGDVTFRARIVRTPAWLSGDSSESRAKVTALPAIGTTIAAADLSPTLPDNTLLNITRRWVVTGNNLQLLFDVSNFQASPIEIGALGAPLEFNNVRYSFA